MSHIVTIATQVRDLEALRAACRRLNLLEPTHETVRLFSGEATGVAVQLPDWQYSVVADLATGTLQYDNFNQRWGKQEHLDKFLQAYAVEKATIEARRRGHTVTEHPDAIREVCGIDLDFSDDDPGADLLAQRLYQRDEPLVPWAELPRRVKTRRRNRVKKWLHTEALDRMTPERLAERDPEGEVRSWLEHIARLASGPVTPRPDFHAHQHLRKGAS